MLGEAEAEGYPHSLRGMSGPARSGEHQPKATLTHSAAEEGGRAREAEAEGYPRTPRQKRAVALGSPKPKATLHTAA